MDFYGKLINCKTYPRLVRICDGDIYYRNANFDEIRIGTCFLPDDELHLKKGSYNCCELNGHEGKYGVQSIRAGRSKSDEFWHRAASLSDNARDAFTKTKITVPKPIGKFHTQFGTASLIALSIIRDGKEVFNINGGLLK